MAKSKTSSYILTLQLKTEKYQEDELNKRFEKCRKIYNSCITELFKRYNNMTESKKYRKNCRPIAFFCTNFIRLIWGNY